MNNAFTLDRDLILDRLGGDQDILQMMAEMFLADVDSYQAALSDCLAAGEANSLMREAHSIKGLLATFSDDAGAEVAQVIELQAKAGELAGLVPLVKTLQERLQEVATVLRAEFSVG